MNKKLLIIISCCFLLNACSFLTSDRLHPTEQKPQDSPSSIALAEAAASVSQSMTNLEVTEQAAYPPVSIKESPDPSTYGMDIPTSIDWEGPVEPLIRQIANAANYQLRVLGSAPAIPIIVSIAAQDIAIGNVLRDVSYQCGEKAQVVVFPSTKVIELRYARS